MSQAANVLRVKIIKAIVEVKNGNVFGKNDKYD